MKIRFLLFGLLACAALASCSKDPDIPTPEPEVEERIKVQLYSEIEQIATTRVNDSGFCDGDAVGIYVVNYENGASGTMHLEGNQVDNMRYLFDETAATWTPDNEVYFLDRTTPTDVIGYYPYSKPTSVTAYPFEVEKDQSTDATNGLMGGYEASDFLYAKNEGYVPSTDGRIPMTFRHRMAGVVVTLVEGTGFAEGEFAAVSKSVLVSNTIRTATIDLSTGDVTPRRLGSRG